MSFYAFEQILEEEGVILSLLSGLLGSIPATVVSIVTYVLTALALYTLASRRGIRSAWLAWIPLGRSWITGSLSDQYRYVARCEDRAKRKTLLILDIIGCLLSIVAAVLSIGVLANLLSSVFSDNMRESVVMGAVSSLLGILGLLLPAAGIRIAYTVVRFMALYDIFGSCDPDNKILFTVLSIFLPITEPFFLFFSRNKDGGMPPRRHIPANPEYAAADAE